MVLNMAHGKMKLMTILKNLQIQISVVCFDSNNTEDIVIFLKCNISTICMNQKHYSIDIFLKKSRKTFAQFTNLYSDMDYDILSCIHKFSMFPNLVRDNFVINYFIVMLEQGSLYGFFVFGLHLTVFSRYS